MRFKLWNYGLYGDENAWDVPSAKADSRGFYLIEIEPWGEFTNFYSRHRVVGIDIGGIGYKASLQLPTTYSTCGEMGYPDAEQTTTNLEKIRKMYRYIERQIRSRRENPPI